jgi:exodeoxyribonuclease X|tara:strand:+ start:245 stop:922 length:678 start_codon:yes stop_codon:yes gene_type:complete
MQAVIFDTETTGKNDPILIEAAWLSVEQIDPLITSESFCERYKPEKPIELGALAVHHILDEELVNCSPAKTFKLPEGIEYIIGHSIDYDWAVVGSPNIKRICTLALARKVWPNIDAYSQSALLYYLDRENAKEILKNAHSAEADVSICAKILSEICKTLNVKTIESLWNLSEEARIPSIMTFGKHKGLPIEDVPNDYKRWLLSQDNIDPYLIQALTKKVILNEPN